ncbi:hypothetical protein DB347_03150 [Opitutaceae bacterium EW11]|nr:hypothetical protein DB347_03150 [Opitutaceae bacterium EW11]
MPFSLRRLRRVLGAFALSCVAALGASAAGKTKPAAVPPPAAKPAVTIERGEIDGAKFAIARPARWNRQVLILAHGFRPETAPVTADLFPDRAAYRALLDDGWAIAKTSYRRNGVIVQDAIRDLDALRAEVVRRLGRPERVLIEGESMGGLIAVLIAERTPETVPLYDGAVAIGAALGMRVPADDSAGLSMQPRIPVVFLSNRSESEAPRRYAEAKLPPSMPVVKPVVLRVSRDGHLNVNQAERFVALRTLNRWLDAGAEALPKPDPETGAIDVTRIPEPVPSRVFPDPEGQGFTAHVSEVTEVFGNLLLDAQAPDFAQAGIAPNGYFQITVRDRTYRAFFGKDFTSVKRGEWVAFPSADGFFWLGRNGLSAAATVQAEIGDLVHVKKYGGVPAEAATPEP